MTTLMHRANLLEEFHFSKAILLKREVPEEEEEPVTIGSLAIPRRSAAQLANKARKAGR